MSKYYIRAKSLNEKFAQHVMKRWVQNNHDLPEIPAVYALIGFDFLEGLSTLRIYYIGSTKNIRERYKSHDKPYKIQDLGLINLMYYLPMENGYSHEVKLIKKLSPMFNIQHNG